MSEYEIYERRDAQQARYGQALDLLVEAATLYLAFLVGWNVGLWMGGV